jgi:ClpP class serine protease
MKYPRILTQIESMRWAITPQALESIYRIASREYSAEDYKIFHLMAEEDREMMIADLGEKVLDSQNAFVKGDTGILLVDGPIIPRASALMASSGHVGISALTADFKAFEADPSIKRAMMLFDSPGGDVVGISEFSSIVSASSMPTLSYVYGHCCSGAIWMAASADEVISIDTGVLGNIGVITALKKGTDDDIVVITSEQSPNKRPDLETKEGRQSIQTVVNGLADVFIDSVSAGRSVTREKVLSDFGKGGNLVAARALEVGMIDKIMTLDALMSSFQPTPAQGGEQGGFKMDLNQFLAENPAAAVELKGRLAAEFERGKTEASKSNKARIESASKYLGTAYSAEIQQLAVKVICGKSNADALDMAVVVADSNKEQIASLQAQIETMATGSTSPGTEMSEIQKELAEDNAIRAEMGLAPLEMRS